MTAGGQLLVQAHAQLSQARSKNEDFHAALTTAGGVNVVVDSRHSWSAAGQPRMLEAPCVLSIMAIVETSSSFVQLSYPKPQNIYYSIP